MLTQRMRFVDMFFEEFSEISVKCVRSCLDVFSYSDK